MTSSPRLLPAAALVCALVAAGCAPSVEVSVQVLTDLAPASEFDRITLDRGGVEVAELAQQLEQVGRAGLELEVRRAERRGGRARRRGGLLHRTPIARRQASRVGTPRYGLVRRTSSSGA